ncbi:mycofactocin-coupled SDR family oxidoreductase [Rhodococcus koreensis]
MMGRVAGKVALVTGAARGQGRAHSVRLAEEGADIIAVDVCAPLRGVQYAAATEDDLRETVEAVEKTGQRIHSATLDTRNLDGLRQVVNEGVDELGSLDIICANAGICIAGDWDTITPQMFTDTIDTNVTGTWNTIMAGAPHLIAAGGGSIIVTSSAGGIKVVPFMVPYTTSKFAVRGMAKAFAAELARHNIRVNSLHPGGVNTPMGGPDFQAVLQPAIERNPHLGGMLTPMMNVDFAEPEDMAAIVLFLASDDSKHMTAHEFAADAGLTEF